MATTKQRSSSQLYIDENLDLNNKKAINLSICTDPSDAANKQYVDNAVSSVIAGADAMVFKGTVGAGGTYTIAAFNALLIYNAGWTFRVIEAGTIKGKICEIGDLLLAIADRASAGIDADWTVAQTNIDGALIKNDFDANTILKADTDNNPVPLTVGEQTFVGRKTGASIAALTPAEARVILNVADGATANTVCTGAEIDTGTDNIKYASPLAIRNSGLISTAANGEFTSLAAKNTPVDADELLIEDSAASAVKRKLTWGAVKATLKTYFDTLYNLYVHPNHSGDVTSVADGATTIANNVVSNAKLADVPVSTMKGRVTAGAGDPEDLTVAQIRTLLGLNAANLSQRTFRVVPSGTVNGSNVTFTIAANVISGTEEVFKNGILMNAGAGNDYTITYGATTTITFATAPSAASSYTDVILVNYSF
ncbi:MAG: hypothetical protein IPN08_05265 [Bacteroidales bacterium]|nr:hypothetical protein [Bacteroidales bacterium]